MKGLLLKDILGLKRYMRTVAILILFYIVFGISTKQPMFVSAMMVLFSAMIPMVTFSYDDSAKWDCFALTLPVRRKEAVMSRYLLSVILVAGGNIISAVFTLAFHFVLNNDLAEQMTVVTVFVAISFGLVSLVLPVLYRFGVEKGRFIIMGIFAAVVLIGFLFSKLNLSMPSEDVLFTILKISPLAALFLFVISYMISCRIYENKQI